jgi:hypothetical protein
MTDQSSDKLAIPYPEYPEPSTLAVGRLEVGAMMHNVAKEVKTGATTEVHVSDYHAHGYRPLLSNVTYRKA